MDLTATAFGLLVTVTGGLFTAVVLLARRELDRSREQVADIDRRLRLAEADLFALQPIAIVLRQKNQEQAERMIDGAKHASKD